MSLNGPHTATLEEHTHHKQGSPDGQCIACHMPEIEATIADVFVRADTFAIKEWCPLEVPFEHGPTRYENKTRVFSLLFVQPGAAAFLPTGIERSGQQSSEMKAQTRGTNGASRNSVHSIAQVRKGSTNAEGNDSNMACSTRISSERSRFHDPLHGKTQTGQSPLKVFGEPPQIMDRQFLRMAK